jgi:Tol biopolymer transport system component
MVAGLVAQQQRPQDIELQAAIRVETVDGNLPRAIEQYKAIVSSYGKTDRRTAAQALLRMADAYQKLGDAQARTTYEQIVRDFSDQVESVSTARVRLASLAGSPVVAPPPLGLVCSDCSDNMSAISRDGRWMAGTDFDSGDLSLRDMATGETRRLQIKPAASGPDDYAMAPIFSPDASQIAYTWFADKPSGSLTQLLVVERRPGAKPRILVQVSDSEWISPLDWSPDSRQLMVEVQKTDRTWQLATVSTTDGSIRVLKSVGWRVVRMTHAKLSPDGKYLAYDALSIDPDKAPALRQPDPVGDRHIYVIAVDTGTETEVTKTAGIDKQPIWSPDGRYLLFQSDRSGVNDLWALPMREGQAAGQAVVVRRDIGEGTNLGITGAGVYYFRRLVRGMRLVSVAEIDIAGNLPARIRIVDSFPGWNPSWSPDGVRLKYTPLSPLADGITFNVVVRRVATGDENRFSIPGLTPQPPLWLGSSTAFLQFVRSPERRAQNVPGSWYWVDAEKGSFREAFSSPRRSLQAALSHDGKTLFQFARDSQVDSASAPFTKVVAVDLVTGQERLLVGLPGASETLPVTGGVGIALSPDGKTLAIGTTNSKTGGRSLWRVNIDGTQFLELSGPFEVGNDSGGKLAWTRDGRAILFAMRMNVTEWRVMRINAGGGRPEFTGLEVFRLDNFSVSPDGSRIAYSNTPASENELWAIDLTRVLSPTRER